MIGRQVTETNTYLSLEALQNLMAEHWDKAEYNDFCIGKPTRASIENYIILPATERFCVIVYGRKAGGLLSRKHKVILAVCDTPAGLLNRLATSIPTKNAFWGIWQISKIMSLENERRGPAEEALQKYTQYMRQLLTKAGYIG